MAERLRLYPQEAGDRLEIECSRNVRGHTALFSILIHAVITQMPDGELYSINHHSGLIVLNFSVKGSMDHYRNLFEAVVSQFNSRKDKWNKLKACAPNTHVF